MAVHNLIAKGDCPVIDANDVTLDLRGFELLGDGTGDGVSFAGGTLESPRENIEVRNGTVRGFVDGVDLGSDKVTNTSSYGASIRSVRAILTSGNGLRVGIDGNVADSLASGNELTGIRKTLYRTITGNTVADS